MAIMFSGGGGSTSSSSSVAPQLVSSGLLAQYNMTDAGGANGFILTDASGNANHGTLGDQAPITNLSLTTNVLTITCTNDYTVGQVVVLSGLTTNPTLNGTSLTVLASGLSSSQFKANLTHADIVSAAETGFAVVTATVPTFLANTGGLSFVAANKQFAALPAALNGAKTMLLVTFFDPAAANNAFGSPIGPNTGSSGLNLMYTTAGTTASIAGASNYRASTWNGASRTFANGFCHGYQIVTLTIAAGGDQIYIYNGPSTAGSTIGTLGSGFYQLGGGHGAGAATWYQGQIVFAAFWSGTLTQAQVMQNTQAVEQLLMQRGLNLNGIPGGGSWQIPANVDTFCVDGDSETGAIASPNLPTITGTANIFNSGQSGQTAETINFNAPYWVDVNLPNIGQAINGGTVGQGANRAGVIVFIGTNDSGFAASIPLGSLARYCRDRKKIGWDKVFVVPVMSRSGADTFKNSFNALVRQYWSKFADGLLDIAAVPVLGADGAANNTVYMSGGLHWNTTVGVLFAGWLYSYAMRRMYGNTINGTPNVASSTVYLAQPEDIYLFADTTSNNVDIYLPPAQFFTGQTVTIKAKAGAPNVLTLRPKPVVSSTISATSLTSTTLTVTVANNFTAGDVVVFSGLNTNTTKNGFVGIIATASASQFTMTVTAASWSGSDTAGTATLANMSQLAAITNLSLTTNVATITASNNFVAGDTVVLTGLTTTAGLNGTSAAVSGTGLSSSSFQIPITHANIGSGAETGYAMKTYAAETIDGGATLTQSNGKTVVLLSQLISSATGGANWIVLQNS